MNILFLVGSLLACFTSFMLLYLAYSFIRWNKHYYEDNLHWRVYRSQSGKMNYVDFVTRVMEGEIVLSHYDPVRYSKMKEEINWGSS